VNTLSELVDLQLQHWQAGEDMLTGPCKSLRRILAAFLWESSQF